MTDEVRAAGPSTDAERAELLATCELEVEGRFVDASNATLLCRLVGTPHRAVYKPQRGEVPLWDFPSGTLHEREVAAYEVDRALGLGMVPTTILREAAPHGRGSLQWFVEHDPEEHYFTMLDRGDPADVRHLRRMVVLDLLLNNTDRKGGHVLRAPDGYVFLVDHGVCFHEDFKVRTVGWHFAEEPIPAEDRALGTTLSDAITSGGAVAATLEPLLAVHELDALVERARMVAERACYLSPSEVGRHPFPWPLL